MGRYDHQFNDLRSEVEAPATVQVDLGKSEDEGRDLTGTKINEPQGDPNKGAADQFEDLPSQRKDPADEQLDDSIVIEGEEPADEGGEGEHDGIPERVARERRLREEAEERVRKIEADNSELRARFDLQDRKAEWDKADAEDEAALTKLKAEKVAAIEAGETATQVDLDDKISDVKARRISRTNERKVAEDAVKKGKQADGSQPVQNPKAQAWIDAHPAYKSDPAFRAAANAADRLVYQSGANANSDDYYREMSRTMQAVGKGKWDAELSKSYLRTGKQPRPAVRGGGSQGVRGGGDGSTVNRQTSSRVTLTRSDIQMLQSMGLDTSDPKVLREAARNKQADTATSRS